MIKFLVTSILWLFSTNYAFSHVIGHCDNKNDYFFIHRASIFLLRTFNPPPNQNDSKENEIYQYDKPQDIYISDPECCSVLKKIPGDFGPEMRPYLLGLQDPFVIGVRMRVLQTYNENGIVKRSQSEKYMYVTCEGKEFSSLHMKVIDK